MSLHLRDKTLPCTAVGITVHSWMWLRAAGVLVASLDEMAGGKGMRLCTCTCTCRYMYIYKTATINDIQNWYKVSQNGANSREYVNHSVAGTLRFAVS